MKFNLLILVSLDDFTHINYLFGACYRVVWLQHFLHVYLLQCYHKEESFLLLAHAFLSSFLSSRMSLGSLLYSVDFSYHCLFWCSYHPRFGKLKFLQADVCLLLTRPCHLSALPYFLAIRRGCTPILNFLRTSPGIGLFSKELWFLLEQNGV